MPTAATIRLTFSRLARVSCFALMAFIAACSSHPTPTSPYVITPTEQAEVPQAPATLDLALAQLPTQRAKHNRYLLAWAGQFLKRNKVTEAKSLLFTLQPVNLPAEKRLQWALLMTQVHLAQQQPDKALALMNNTQLGIPALLKKAPQTTRNRFDLLQADTLLLQGKLQASIDKRVQIDPLLNDKNQRYNENMIWAVLMRLPEKQLNIMLNSSQGDLLGWAKLASIYRKPLSSLEQQSYKVRQWRENWPNHPANERLPTAIKILQQASRESPEKVAVLLPSSGNWAAAASAIRDGLITGYYHALPYKNNPPKLVFIDSSQGNIVQLYLQAVANGAEFVVGPLAKSKLDALLQLHDFPVPVLALNYDTQDRQLPANFVEYGLAPEDEAQQVARQAWREGKHNVGVLYPRSKWGQRVATAFINDWQQLGGTVLTAQSYENGGSKAIPKLLLTKESQQRERDVRRYTPLKVHFHENPRQDMDFIFLVANASQGRMVKPILNFHFASRIPVYSLSYIYQGHPTPAKDKDLNGVRFLDIPWRLNKSKLHQKTNRIWPDQHGAYQSLYAMGMDSYQLIDHLVLLKADANLYFPGQTGTLSLGKDNRIQRQLNWAVFYQGTPKSLPIVASGFTPLP